MMHVDWIMICSLLLTLVILLITILAARKSRRFFGEDVPKFTIKLRNSWLVSSIAFLVAYYWCILNSILSTLIVLHLGCIENTSQDGIKSRIILYSATALFTSLCPYIVNLRKIAKHYRCAYNRLEAKLLGNGNIAETIKNCEEEILRGFDD